MRQKTLGDYISFGRHEFVAFVRNMMSINDTSRSNYGTFGNDLGNIHFGVLVCDRKQESERNKEEDKAILFYKEPPRFKRDSNVMFHNFNYSSARIVSEVPLGLEVSHFHSGFHFETGSKEFKQAKELLERYGLY